jgi:hypothetical protein
MCFSARTAQNGTGERHVDTIITVTNTHDKKAPLKQQHLRAPPASAIRLLLTDFGIGPPNDRHILDSNPSPEYVRALMLYAVTEPGLQDPRTACGYVVNRLMAKDDPPVRFRCWAKLAPDDWRILWRAGRYGGPYVARAKEMLSGFQQTGWSPDGALAAWQSDFRAAFPRGPFGEGQIAVEALEELMREHLSPADDFHFRAGRHTLEAIPDTEEAHAWLVGAKADLEQLLEQGGILHHLAVRPCPTMEDNTQASPDQKATALWQRILAELKMQVTQATFDTLLPNSQGLELKNGYLVVAAPNPRAKEWLERRLLTTIERTIQRTNGGEAQGVHFVAAGEQREVAREQGACSTTWGSLTPT